MSTLFKLRFSSTILQSLSFLHLFIISYFYIALHYFLSTPALYYTMKLHANAAIGDLEGSVLIVPDISIGNPQLASDLLLHSISFAKFATLDDQYLYPFASPVDYATTTQQPAGISLGIEVYLAKEKKVALVQQRAPIMPGFAAQHVQDVLVPFIKEGNFKHVFFLELSDAGLVGGYMPGQVNIYTNEDLLSKSLFSLLIEGVKPLKDTPDQDSPYARAFFEAVGKTASLTAFVTYVYEGDNFYDAQSLAAKVCEALEMKVETWQHPVSWFGVYGDRPVPLAMEEGMYG